MSTKQFCDRCNSEVPSNNELYVLSICNTKGLASKGRSGMPAIKPIDLCPGCFVKLKELLVTD